MLRFLLNATNFQSPLLRTVVPTVATAFVLQGAVALPSILARSERFYDLSGSLTYISCTAVSLLVPALRARSNVFKTSGGKHGYGSFWDWRQLALSAAVGIWATRLGTHLFARITRDGEDSRFKGIRDSPPKFLVAFMAQATWVSLCLLPVMSLNAVPPAALKAMPRITPIAVLGIGVFISGLCLEVIADRQKEQWIKEKREKKHSEEFLTRGLWSRSRHPNYFGEMTFWTGIAVLSGGILASSAGQKGLGLSGSVTSRLLCCVMAGASPAFTTFLLTKVSGVPLSESKYDKRYGDRKEYQEWKRNTPMLVPKIW